MVVPSYRVGWGSAKVRLILEKALYVSRLFVEWLAALVGSIPAFTCRRAQDMLVLWSACIQSDSRVGAPACLLEAFETGADRKVPSARNVEKFRTGRAKRFEEHCEGPSQPPYALSNYVVLSLYTYLPGIPLRYPLVPHFQKPRLLSLSRKYSEIQVFLLCLMLQHVRHPKHGFGSTVTGCSDLSVYRIIAACIWWIYRRYIAITGA